VLVRFDIKTEKFQGWIIPGGGGVMRNMKSTPDGNLVMAESGVNKAWFSWGAKRQTVPSRRPRRDASGFSRASGLLITPRSDAGEKSVKQKIQNEGRTCDGGFFVSSVFVVRPSHRANGFGRN
jgi:hypothetical protein